MVLSAAHLERTIVAINDQPIAAVLDGAYRLAPASGDVEAVHDVRLSLGLSFNMELRR